MKRKATLTLVVIIAIAMTLALTACGGNDATPAATPAPTPAATPAATPTPSPTPTPTPEPTPVPDPGEAILGYWGQGDDGNGGMMPFLFLDPNIDWLYFAVTESGEGRIFLPGIGWGRWTIDSDGNSTMVVDGFRGNFEGFEESYAFAVVEDILTISYMDFERAFQRATVPLITRAEPILGVIDGNTYTSEYLGLRIDFPDGRNAYGEGHVLNPEFRSREEQLERLGIDSILETSNLWYTVNSFADLLFIGNNSQSPFNRISITFSQLMYMDLDISEVDYINNLISERSSESHTYDFDSTQTPIRIGNSLWYSYRIESITSDFSGRSSTHYTSVYVSVYNGFVRTLSFQGQHNSDSQSAIDSFFFTYP